MLLPSVWDFWGDPSANTMYDSRGWIVKLIHIEMTKIYWISVLSKMSIQTKSVFWLLELTSCLPKIICLEQVFSTFPQIKHYVRNEVLIKHLKSWTCQLLSLCILIQQSICAAHQLPDWEKSYHKQLNLFPWLFHSNPRFLPLHYILGAYSLNKNKNKVHTLQRKMSVKKMK